MPAATLVRFGPPLLLDEAFTHRERAMAELPTVRIVNPSNPDEFIVINERDYDEAEHTLWEEGEEQGGADGDPLAELSVSDLRDALEEVDDVGRLEALLEGEDRKTGRDAIVARLEELAEGEG